MSGSWLMLLGTIVFAANHFAVRMLTLYDFGNSVCCQKVRITMRAKGLAWDAIKVDLFTSQQYDPEYLRLNPKGVVPTLVHDGKPVIEFDSDL